MTASYQFSPLDVITSIKKKFPDEHLYITESTVSDIIHTMLRVNRHYTARTVENTLHYMINCQITMSVDEIERLHLFVKQNISDFYESHQTCLCCYDCLDIFS